MNEYLMFFVVAIFVFFVFEIGYFSKKMLESQ